MTNIQRMTYQYKKQEYKDVEMGIMMEIGEKAIKQ